MGDYNGYSMNEELAVDRTSAVGLFNFARSYWRSAEQLRGRPARVTHPDSPITFLLCHALELYLKAYLRGVGRDIADLKRIGHRVADLSRAAVSAGLKLSPEHVAILSHIDDTDAAIEARYIVTGLKRWLPNEALSEIAREIDSNICDALAKLNLAVRSEAFPTIQNTPNAELSEGSQRVLTYLFEIVDSDLGGVSRMSVELGINEGMLKYHLDCLDDAGLALCGSADDYDKYWAITPEGRKYAVQHHLVE